MSTRTLFESNKVEYLLPTSAGAQVGDVLQLAAGGQLEFAAGGGGGGLEPSDVWANPAAPYTLPNIATASNAQVLTVDLIGGVNTLVFADSQTGDLTQAEVYGTGQPYQLPVLADAANNTVMTVSSNAGVNTLVFSAQTQGLTAGEVWQNPAAPYVLPPLGADTTVATVSGGVLTYAPLPPALNAGQVWVAEPNYQLPNINGAGADLSLACNGSNQLAFTNIVGVGLTAEAVYGAGNAPFALGALNAANPGDVLTAVGSTAVWRAPAGGVAANQVWTNPAVQAKIPDFTAKLPGDVLTLTNVDGTTDWISPPGVPSSAVWAAPNAPYKLPAIGTPGQVLQVATDPNTLVFAPPPTITTSTQEFAYTANFETGGGVEPAYVTFAQTGKMIVCSIRAPAISSNGITGANLNTINFVPTAGQPQLADFMPSTSPNPLYLGMALITQSSGAGSPSIASGWLSVTPNNYNFRWQKYDGTVVDNSQYAFGSAAFEAPVQAGAWATP